ncbi:hypothetical protein R3P38DRAFT_3375232 [Favolaschia claudopus]|uniref:C2H2-type domain-containing protein n=1 Tax=Favolaschia claudopus TaxID=2862362 RepID=A0AAV9ZJA8_9AGAR
MCRNSVPHPLQAVTVLFENLALSHWQRCRGKLCPWAVTDLGQISAETLEGSVWRASVTIASDSWRRFYKESGELGPPIFSVLGPSLVSNAALLSQTNEKDGLEFYMSPASSLGWTMTNASCILRAAILGDRKAVQSSTPTSHLSGPVVDVDWLPYASTCFPLFLYHPHQHMNPDNASASTSQMFPNATQFDILGGHFTNVHGNLNLQPNLPSAGVLAAAASAASTPTIAVSNAPTSRNVVYSESGNYTSLLLRQGRGFPLYIPAPPTNLPAAYRRNGVAIGDVGRVTPEGSFDFFFNIYLPRGHRINANTPPDFAPLLKYESVDVTTEDYDAGTYVASPAVQETSSDHFPGGAFVFDCQGPDGAVLTLPHGAQLEKLENLESMRQYAAKNAESWYKYVNQTRGRGLSNGSLYLVTGWEKAESWGMATFQDVPVHKEFQLSFIPTTDAAHGHRYRWQGAHSHRKYKDLQRDLNQTTFIHAFAISVCSGVWEKLFGGKEACQMVNSSTFTDASGCTFIPYGSSGSSSIWSFFGFGGGSSTGGGRQNTAQASDHGDGMVSTAFPISTVIHPSQLIHEHVFREVPTAKVVITHDDDWRDIFRVDSGRQLHLSTLKQALTNHFDIVEEGCFAFLRANVSAVVSQVNQPTAKAVNQHFDEQHLNSPPEQPETASSTIVTHSASEFADGIAPTTSTNATRAYGLAPHSQSFGEHFSPTSGEPVLIPSAGSRLRAHSDNVFPSSPIAGFRLNSSDLNPFALEDDISPPSDSPSSKPRLDPIDTGPCLPRQSNHAAQTTPIPLSPSPGSLCTSSPRSIPASPNCPEFHDTSLLSSTPDRSPLTRISGSPASPVVPRGSSDPSLPPKDEFEVFRGRSDSRSKRRRSRPPSSIGSVTRRLSEKLSIVDQPAYSFDGPYSGAGNSSKLLESHFGEDALLPFSQNDYAPVYPFPPSLPSSVPDASIFSSSNLLPSPRVVPPGQAGDWNAPSSVLLGADHFPIPHGDGATRRWAGRADRQQQLHPYAAPPAGPSSHGEESGGMTSMEALASPSDNLFSTLPSAAHYPYTMNPNWAMGTSDYSSPRNVTSQSNQAGSAPGYRRSVATSATRRAAKRRRKDPSKLGAHICEYCGDDFTAAHNLKFCNAFSEHPQENWVIPVKPGKKSWRKCRYALVLSLCVGLWPLNY